MVINAIRFRVALPVLWCFLVFPLGAQQKYALVIGNGAYANFGSLRNAVNDAQAMETTLRGLGFTVDKVINGSLEQMEVAVDRLKNRLSNGDNAYGFFYYAGHGVEYSGENFLIPADANIRGASYLRNRALSVQIVLNELNRAGNALNVIVLDACRNLPNFPERDIGRGLAVVNPPSNSIVMYATAAGETAADGEGANGLFTTHLLNNLKSPGMEVTEMFRRTGRDVAQASGNKQRTAVYIAFYESAYLGSKPQGGGSQPSVASTGSVQVNSEVAGVIIIDGKDTGVRVKSGGSAVVAQVSTGDTTVAVRGDDGKVIGAPNVRVSAGQTAAAQVKKPAAVTVQPAPAPAPTPKPTPTSIPRDMVRIQGGTFTMGSPSSEAGRYDWEGPQHSVTVSSFYMGKYEVTQREYQEVMGNNPSAFKGDTLPVETVSWFDAVEYCNKRSQREGLTPAYTISGSGDSRTVSWNRQANGYRLPTEAEWEYACRAGTSTPYYTGSSVDSAGWYSSNSGSTTHPVGQKQGNVWGLYDMHGNVWEWCWDWYGSYSNTAQSDPAGASSGTYRVRRGGGWIDSADNLRSAYRRYSAPSDRYGLLGFRLVRPAN